MNCRFVRIDGGIYLRKEDVVRYLLDTAECEETDTRNRLTRGAENLLEVGCPESRDRGIRERRQKLR